MAFNNFKKLKFTEITASVNTKHKESYRKIPASLRLGKKSRTQGSFFDYNNLIQQAIDKTQESPLYDDNSVFVEQDPITKEIGVYIKSEIFRENFKDYFPLKFSTKASTQISKSFFEKIGKATTNIKASERYVGILASPFEEGSIGSGTDIIPPVTASLSILESPGIAHDLNDQPRTRKITYFNSSSNFTNSHFFFNYRTSTNDGLKFGDAKQEAATNALVNAGKSHLTRSFTSIFTSPKSKNMFYYVQATPIKEWSVEMTSSAGTASFYALTSSFSGAADFGVTKGGITTSSAFLGNSIETSSNSHPKFYNGVNSTDGKWTYVVQKGVIEGEGENSLGEEDYKGDTGANFAFTPQQLLVWYEPEYYYSNVRSASYYFTPYPENMHKLNTGLTTKNLVTHSISSSEIMGTGELRTLYWLNHTYTSSFTGSFGNFTRGQLRNRTNDAKFHQLPYMNTHKAGTANSYFGRKQRDANSSHLWKDKYLSVPTDMGYYVHSSSFSAASKNQMSASLGSANHTSSFFVMGVFKHPFIQIIDGNIMNYSASQEREAGVIGTSWMNHHPIASCMFLKRYDDQVFVYHASASGFIISESVG